MKMDPYGTCTLFNFVHFIVVALSKKLSQFILNWIVILEIFSPFCCGFFIRFVVNILLLGAMPFRIHETYSWWRFRFLLRMATLNAELKKIFDELSHSLGMLSEYMAMSSIAMTYSSVIIIVLCQNGMWNFSSIYSYFVCHDNSIDKWNSARPK